IVLFVIFFTMSCIVIMKLSYHKQSSDYVPVLRDIVGKRLTSLYDVMIFLYLITMTIVMIAGSGADVQAFNLPYWSGIAIIVITLIFMFSKDINGVLSINQFIIPILIIGLLYVLVLFTYDQELSLF